MKRSSVNKLPREVKAWLDNALVDQQFTGYRDLANEMARRGYSITKSSLHRYGQEFEEQLGALKLVTEQAKAIAETAPDDANSMGDALTRLVQQKAFAALAKLQDSDDLSLSAISRIVYEMNRHSIAQKKWSVALREKLKAAADLVDQVGRRNGLSDEAAEQIRTQILGLAVKE